MREYKIIGDMHTHTLVSQHAYSTIGENIAYSKKLGLQCIGWTDHGPETEDGAISHHFFCLNSIPEFLDEIRVFKGAEVNIKSFQGRIDLNPSILHFLDWVIASYHIEAIEFGTKEENTEGWLNVIKNPYVDCLGHAGNPVYDFEHEVVIKALKDSGKILEINSNSFTVRKGSKENCSDIIRLCKKYDVPVVATSDAHIMYRVGDVKESLELLKELEYPAERILNSSFSSILDYIDRRKKEKATVWGNHPI
ncbi:phosphatase [Treponema parvum]|uniref:Phosphatase n=1 Tax=Treponema parvum TaxID=138851 RepID=A0A975EY11_9SPIR|nr:phosphatase [Treponema parvum]QTQ11075.1 phosphatase [Treponema parvum]